LEEYSSSTFSEFCDFVIFSYFGDNVCFLDPPNLNECASGLISTSIFELISPLLFQSCLLAVTATQTVHDEFLALGGFSLFSPLLFAMREERAHLLGPVLSTLLEASALRIGTDTILLYPHLVSVCLKCLAQLESTAAFKAELWLLLLTFLNSLLIESNTALELNLNMVSGSELLDSLLASLQTIGREEETLGPLAASISQLLTTLPANADTLRKLLNLSLGCLPPHLLYLPHLTCPLLGRAGAPGEVEGGEAPLLSNSYINKIHSTDVIGRRRSF